VVVLNVHKKHKDHTVREKGEGVWRCWEIEKEIIYLSLHCHHQNDSCIEMGSNESHFNVSLIVRDRVTRQCPQTTFPKRRESRSGIKPRSFCIPTVPLGQTGSQLNVDRIAPDLMLHRVGLWASFWGVITVKIVYLKRVRKNNNEGNTSLQHR